MTTVSELELEQKTSEYIHYAREFFVTNKDSYASKKMAIRLDADSNIITLKYEGK